MDLFSGIKRFAGDIFKPNNNVAKATVSQPVQVSVVERPDIAPNIERVHDAFSTNEMRDRSGGAISPMSRQGASGMTGNYVVETGDPLLANTDVIEEKAKKGRGIAQYTAARRGPYDAARLKHIAAGGDPNDIDFQLQHAAEEYAGLHDPAPGRSLVGYTGALSGETDGMGVADSATHLRKDFFRPSVPHNDRRVESAQQIDDAIQKRDERLAALSTNAGLKNSSMAQVGHRGVDGRYWAGDDYGWQSSDTFKKLIGY